MAIIGMRELLRDPTRVFDAIEKQREPVLVTNRGRPVAALYPVDANRAEELMLATAPEYVESRRRAERARAEGRTRSLEEAIDEYNLRVEPDERIEPAEVEPEGGVAGAALPVPIAELRAMFGAAVAHEVASEADRRISEISDSLVDSAEATGRLRSEQGEAVAGSEDRKELAARIGELSAQLFGDVMREILLRTAAERVVALETSPADPLLSSDPSGMFGKHLAEETLEAAATLVEQFNEEILRIAPDELGTSGLLATYEASIKGASVLERVAHLGRGSSELSSLRAFQIRSR